MRSIYCTYIRPSAEYACPVWHPGLSASQSDKLEVIQKRAIRIILGNCYTSYEEGLRTSSLTTLKERRHKLTMDFGLKCLCSEKHRDILPKFENGKCVRPGTRGQTKSLGLQKLKPPPTKSSERYKKDDEWMPDPEDLPCSKNRGRKPAKVPTFSSQELERGYMILENLTKNKNISWNFLEAVDPVNDCAADYYEITQKPMWFKRIRDNFFSQEYFHLQDVIRDIRQIFVNAYFYNGADNLVSKRALRLENLLEEQLQLLPSDLQNACSLTACYGEDYCSNFDKETNAKIARKDGLSYLLVHAIADREKFEIDRKIKQDLEVKTKREVEEARRGEWNDIMECKELKEYLHTAWEVPQIGQFLSLASATLNFQPLTVFELERMLLCPQLSNSLDLLMTTLLSNPFLRPKLGEKPPMPYSYWSVKLANRVTDWFKIYTKEKKNVIKLVSDYGLEKSFWEELDHKNPFEQTEFSGLSLKQRWIVLKGICDYVMHAHKSVQEAVMNESDELQTPRILGEDGNGYEYFYFPQVTGWDVRVYKQKQNVYSPEEDDVWADLFKERGRELAEFEERVEAAKLQAEAKAREEEEWRLSKRKKSKGVSTTHPKRNKSDKPSTPRPKPTPRTRKADSEVVPKLTHKKASVVKAPKSSRKEPTPVPEPNVADEGTPARISSRIRERGGKRRSFFGYDDADEDLPLSAMKKSLAKDGVRPGVGPKNSRMGTKNSDESEDGKCSRPGSDESAVSLPTTPCKKQKNSPPKRRGRQNHKLTKPIKNSSRSNKALADPDRGSATMCSEPLVNEKGRSAADLTEAEHGLEHCDSVDGREEKGNVSDESGTSDVPKSDTKEENSEVASMNVDEKVGSHSDSADGNSENFQAIVGGSSENTEITHEAADTCDVVDGEGETRLIDHSSKIGSGSVQGNSESTSSIPGGDCETVSPSVGPDIARESEETRNTENVADGVDGVSGNSSAVVGNNEILPDPTDSNSKNVEKENCDPDGSCNSKAKLDLVCIKEQSEDVEKLASPLEKAPVVTQNSVQHSMPKDEFNLGEAEGRESENLTLNSAEKIESSNVSSGSEESHISSCVDPKVTVKAEETPMEVDSPKTEYVMKEEPEALSIKEKVKPFRKFAESIRESLKVGGRKADLAGFDLVASGYKDLQELVSKLNKLKSGDKAKTGKLVTKLQSLLKEIEPHLDEIIAENAETKEKMYREYEKYLTRESGRTESETVWFGKEEPELPPPVVEVKKKESFYDLEKPIEEATEVGSYRLRKRRHEEEYPSEESSESEGPYSHQMRYSTRIATGSIDFRKFQDIESEVSSEEEMSALEEMEKNLKQAGISLKKSVRKPQVEATPASNSKNTEVRTSKIAAEIGKVLDKDEQKKGPSTPSLPANPPVKRFPCAIRRIEPRSSSGSSTPEQRAVTSEASSAVSNRFYPNQVDSPMLPQRIPTPSQPISRLATIDLSKCEESSVSISRLQKPKPILTMEPKVELERMPIPNSPGASYTKQTYSGVISRSPLSRPRPIPVSTHRGVIRSVGANAVYSGPQQNVEAIAQRSTNGGQSPSEGRHVVIEPRQPVPQNSFDVARPVPTNVQTVMPQGPETNFGKSGMGSLTGAVRQVSVNSLAVAQGPILPASANRPVQQYNARATGDVHPPMQRLPQPVPAKQQQQQSDPNSEVRVRIDVNGGVVVENSFRPSSRPIAPPPSARKVGSSTAQFQPSQWSSGVRQRFTSNNAYLNKQLKYKPELPPEPRFLQRPRDPAVGLPEVILPVRHADGTVVNKKFIGKDAEFILNQLSGAVPQQQPVIPPQPAAPVVANPVAGNNGFQQHTVPDGGSDILSQAMLNTVEEPKPATVQFDLSEVLQQALANGHLQQGVNSTICVSLGDYGYYNVSVQWNATGPEVVSYEQVTVLQNG